MPESPDLFAEVALLRDEVEDQGEMIDSLVRASGKELKAEILNAMKEDPALAQIFLLVDGRRTQGEIVKVLTDRKVKGASAAGVSLRMQRLHKDLYLVHLVRRVAGGNVYRRSRLDQALGISRAVSSKKG
jgi:hypothetical protein